MPGTQAVRALRWYRCVPQEHGLDGALRAAGAAGGGVVLFGPGRYQMGGPVHVPHRTVLRGDGIDRTSLWWDDDANLTASDFLIGTNLSCNRPSLSHLAALPSRADLLGCFVLRPARDVCGGGPLPIVQGRHRLCDRLDKVHGPARAAGARAPRRILP